MLTTATIDHSRNSSWRFLSERKNGRIFQYDHPLSARSRAARAAWSSGAKSLSESYASSSGGVRLVAGAWRRVRGSLRAFRRLVLAY